jgi:uncharacterized protein with HEPN domain
MTRGRRDLRVYLGDMLGAIARIEEYTAFGEQSFLSNGLVQDGVIRQLSVLGEAASKLPAAMRARHPDIPWKSIIGMRNLLVQDGDTIQLPHVWKTVVRDPPPLRRAVDSILDTWRNNGGDHPRSRPRRKERRAKAS